MLNVLAHCYAKDVLDIYMSVANVFRVIVSQLIRRSECF